MTFKKLSQYFFLLEQNSSRLKITEILARLFAQAGEEEIDKICYLSLGRLLPSYRGLEFQMAEKMMQKAIAKAFGIDQEKVLRRYQEKGDLGLVAEEFKEEFKGKKQALLFGEDKPVGDGETLWVYEELLAVANEAGEGSVERKIGKMASLLGKLDGLSVRYIVRILLGKMRLGFSEMTVLDGLSWMITGDKSLRLLTEDAYNVVADVGEIARNIKASKGIEGLRKIKPKLGTPIIPALCQRIGTAEEIVEKLGKIAVEPKYDGTRLQVHLRKQGVSIFTRNLENVTHMFPDIVQALKKEVKVEEAIFDGEGLGIDPKTKKYLPFQETIKRKRKHNIASTAKEIPLKYFVFDILYENGESLIKEPFEKRRKILAQTVSAKGKVICLSPQILTSDPNKLRQYHDEQIKNGLEGIVAKKWQSVYEPGRRGFHWVKLKQEMTKKGGGLADTVDCVIMGVTRGKGKRAGFGVGSFLAGIRKNDKYVTITNIGTGLSDEQFKDLNKRSKKLKIKEKPRMYLVDKNQEPDTWLEPEIVAEIQADNITKSSIHTAGVALRFPRLIRFRDDRDPSQATTLGEVEKLYGMQFGNEGG
ncbi:DNA ligase [Candidatus Shapirobacteria bacterium CG03_land_8_20_14_0_80_40_19]|uniref:Probable DNA ligase n=4 Tax=Candidatus Shapironibacteriota TaxID=1752721 RepID=A0A2M7BDM3_9BACT|nr:MAG: DNA ligase [Candidatus Shapirobacteria bacterium CG11_big_fil_rev_8_21_14_0_20_40_12]PIV01212.1 MAG: DNA ligase [Candidatus Shapirobacteria bacterium CG03_land_8_20_14_0_80_40_19]PJC28582.1 MAG: DNA ligase [Candidatus Shapirobacteria bacterium CG_4_9_14_0_2_um_filter_40_11]PJC77541.1 MAG: DNA ligase [Candidatus Shapirobacteria bacterium CG_4_8_14_3_um_filter_39_11]